MAPKQWHSWLLYGLCLFKLAFRRQGLCHCLYPTLGRLGQWPVGLPLLLWRSSWRRTCHANQMEKLWDEMGHREDHWRTWFGAWERAGWVNDLLYKCEDLRCGLRTQGKPEVIVQTCNFGVPVILREERQETLWKLKEQLTWNIQPNQTPRFNKVEGEG